MELNVEIRIFPTGGIPFPLPRSGPPRCEILLNQGRILRLAKVHGVVHVVLEIHLQGRFGDYPLRLQAVRVRMLVGIAVVQVVVARGGLLSFATEPVPVCGGRFRFAAKDRRYQLAVLGGEMAIALMHLAVACGHHNDHDKNGCR